MAIERDNSAERLARVDKLIADMKPTPAEQQTARLQTLMTRVAGISQCLVGGAAKSTATRTPRSTSTEKPR